MNTEIYEVVCHICFGKGEIPEEGYADCPYCDGTGFYEEFDYEETMCDTCINNNGTADTCDLCEEWLQGPGEAKYIRKE